MQFIFYWYHYPFLSLFFSFSSSTNLSCMLSTREQAKKLFCHYSRQSLHVKMTELSMYVLAASLGFAKEKYRECKVQDWTRKFKCIYHLWIFTGPILRKVLKVMIEGEINTLIYISISPLSFHFHASTFIFLSFFLPFLFSVSP